MHRIYVLWATPRSTSTAFEWMMRMRGDMICFHEPFGEAWYQGDDARAPRLTGNSPRKPGLTFASVLAAMKTAAKTGPVFSKDMPHYTDHLWEDGLLDNFHNSFLIRDPAKVLSSLQRSYDKAGKTEGFTRHEIGFDAQRRLFDLLTERNGAPPPVIDSDDLLESPHNMVKTYCMTIGIPFIPNALSWNPGERREVLWYDSDDSIWHETLRNSDGLKRRPRRVVSVEELSAQMQMLYYDFLPHYQHLYQYRLGVCAKG